MTFDGRVREDLLDKLGLTEEDVLGFVDMIDGDNNVTLNVSRLDPMINESLIALHSYMPMVSGNWNSYFKGDESGLDVLNTKDLRLYKGYLSLCGVLGIHLRFFGANGDPSLERWKQYLDAERELKGDSNDTKAVINTDFPDIIVDYLEHRKYVK